MGVACGAAAIMNPGTTLCKPEDVGIVFNEVQFFPKINTTNAAASPY
jgi:hypothetical protein